MRRPVLMLLVALHCGCAGLAHPERPPVPTGLGRVVVVASREPAVAVLEGYARSKPGGAARGFGETFVQCTGALGSGSCSGAFCGAVVIAWLGVCTVAGTVGGAVGAIRAENASDVRAHEAQIHGTIDQSPVQEVLRDSVVAALAARGHPLPAARAGAAAPEADTFLEVGVTQIGTVGRGIKPPLQLHLKAQARLVRASDGLELYAADFGVAGERHSLEEWSADGGARLVAGMRAGYAELGEEIATVFLPAVRPPD